MADLEECLAYKMYEKYWRDSPPNWEDSPDYIKDNWRAIAATAIEEFRNWAKAKED